MATKKGKPRAPRVPEDEFPQIPEELIEPAAAPVDFDGLSNIENQIGALSSEAKVHVHRIRHGMRPPFAFLFATTGKDFSIEDVAARYGGGEYHVKAWQKGISGALINERFSIEGEPIVPLRGVGAQPAPVASGQNAPMFYQLPGGNAQGDAIAALGAMMRDTLTQIAQLVSNNRGSRADAMRETVEMATMLKTLMGERADPLAMLGQVMGIIREAQPMTGEGGHADAWSVLQTAAEKLLPAIISAGQQAPQPQQLPRPTAALPGAPANFPPRPQPEPPATIGEAVRAGDAPPAPRGNGQMMPAQLAMFIRPLVNAARLGADVETYADLIGDQIEAAPIPDLGARVEAFLRTPEWFAQIVQIVPEAAGFAPWFAQLRETLLAPPEEGDGDLTGVDDAGISGAEDFPNGPLGGGRH